MYIFDMIKNMYNVCSVIIKLRIKFMKNKKNFGLSLVLLLAVTLSTGSLAFAESDSDEEGSSDTVTDDEIEEERENGQDLDHVAQVHFNIANRDQNVNNFRQN